MPWPLSGLPDIDTPPLSPSSATRSSVASSSSSLSSGELSSRGFKMRTGSRVVHESTECLGPQGSPHKYLRDGVIVSGTREGDIVEELDADMECNASSFDSGGAGHEFFQGHSEHTSRPRPQMPRQNSYSKRHSSFDTPREVPFPYGYLARSLSDHSGMSGDARYERPTSIPLSHPGISNCNPDETVASGNHSLALTESEGGSANGGSTFHRPHLERSSTSSLPLLTSTPYSALPPTSSSRPSPRPDYARAPVVLPSSLTMPTPGFPSPLGSLTRTASLNPPDTKVEPARSLSQSRSTQFSRSPDSPPFMVDEPDNPSAVSTGPTSHFPPPSFAQDIRPYHSLPPPPRLSSFSSTSPLPFRLMSLSHPNGSVKPLSGVSPLPPPEPPIILTPSPPLSDAEAKTRTPAPYEPFLPREQPPPDHTYIAVETVPEEYRLLVRLPGFQRDSITLAMRRRRILHVVADNWSDGGGHFERRISFGYDADLASVRAEFDGEILRIIVPRRDLPGWYTQQTN